MKAITYTCPYVPAEWIAAHGLKPVRITPKSIGSTCPSARREGVCPYVGSFINELVTNEQLEGIIVTTLCDQMRRAYDIIVRDCNSPVFLMNVLNTWQNLSAQKLYIDELKRLGKFLIRLGGKEPSTDNLIRVMLDYDSARQSILQARDNLSARQFAEVIADFNCNGSDKIHATNSAMEPITTGVPLAILGGPLMRQNFDILDIAEQFGGRIVLNAIETGERGMCPPFNRRNLLDDPFLELVNAYFTGIQDASRRPNSGLYKWLQNRINNRAVRGIIFHRYLWCDMWHAESRRLKDWINIPVLDIDTTGGSESEKHRTATRIHAFLEMFK